MINSDSLWLAAMVVGSPGSIRHFKNVTQWLPAYRDTLTIFDLHWKTRSSLIHDLKWCSWLLTLHFGTMHCRKHLKCCTRCKCRCQITPTAPWRLMWVDMTQHVSTGVFVTLWVTYTGTNRPYRTTVYLPGLQSIFFEDLQMDCRCFKKNTQAQTQKCSKSFFFLLVFACFCRGL